MEDRLRPSTYARADIDLRERDVLWKEWGRLERYRLRHRRYDGSWSNEIVREVYTNSEVATVLPYDPALDAVALVEQFRPCGLAWDEATWIFEVIAGVKEPGETPEQVARREAEEEAKCQLRATHQITTAYSSPGALGEKAFMFAATADLSNVGGNHGLANENEDIRAVVVPLDDALAAIDDGRLCEVKTMFSILWVARNKARLSAG